MVGVAGPFEYGHRIFLGYALFKGQMATTTLLALVHNVHFKHRGVAGRFWYKATDWTYGINRLSTSGIQAVQDMHAELGAPIFLFPC